MKTSQEQITKALAGLIPEDAQKSVQEAISTFIESAISELEEEYNAKLEDTYKQVSDEKKQDESVAEEGYSQAWEIITDLRDRLEVQKEEFDQALEEGYEEAYQMLQEERAKNDTLEVDLYEEYDKRLADIKEYMVDKIDQFLQLQGEKYYEMAKRDVMNDPTVAEHKLAFEEILGVASKYLSDEDHAFATTTRVEGMQKILEEQKAQMRIMEAKNMRLKTDNDRLNESFRQQQEVINEHTNRSDKKERLEKAKKAEGRGQLETDKKRQVVLAEYADETVQRNKDRGSDEPLVERIGEEVFNDWKHLSGLTKDEEVVSDE